MTGLWLRCHGRWRRRAVDLARQIPQRAAWALTDRYVGLPGIWVRVNGVGHGKDLRLVANIPQVRDRFRRQGFRSRCARLLYDQGHPGRRPPGLPDVDACVLGSRGGAATGVCIYLAASWSWPSRHALQDYGGARIDRHDPITRGRGSRHWDEGHAKPNVIEGITGTAVTAIRRPAEVPREVITATAIPALRPRIRPRRIDHCATRIRALPIRTPLPDVPIHVIQPPAIRQFCPNRMRL